MNYLDTIAAVSTPYGKGGIAVLRVSGSDALEIAGRVFKPKNGKHLSETDSSKAVYGDIFGVANGESLQIDDGIAVCFRAPRSFTGEDTVEISCHGGVLVTSRVLSALLSAGARPAMAGEFTKRAFINGKMTLTSAEALGELLEAKTDEQISLARSGMKGILSGKIGYIYNSLCNVLAGIFAKIDYPDEDLADIGFEEMLDAVNENLVKLKALASTYSTGHAVAEGVPTVILGRTNAGKSSLYNRILGRDAAIVTDIEGTTRDILTDSAKLGRVVLRLSDTAGLRSSLDTVEKIGIDRAKEAAENAELIFAVFDGSREPNDSDRDFISYISSLSGIKIAILNKSDLGLHSSYAELLSDMDKICHISAESGDGFEALISAVEEKYIDCSLDTAKDAIITNARQSAAINGAIEALEIAGDAIKNELPLEICCAEVENTLSALGELDGRTVSEDIVSRIFANFCVGK